MSHVPEKLLITKAIYQLSLNTCKYNKSWLNTNLAKTPNLFTVEFQQYYCFEYSEKRIASIHENFLPSLAFILFACKNMAFYTKQDNSIFSFPQPTLSTVKCPRGYRIYFSLRSVILNRLAATKRAWIRRP